MNYQKKLIVEPGRKFRFDDLDPGYHGKHESEADAKAESDESLAALTSLQRLLYGERKHALLIVLQGIDAAGKDGVCWHIIKAMNPQGTTRRRLQAAHRGGARARLPLARPPARPRPRPGGGLEPLSLRGRARGARPRAGAEVGVVRALRADQRVRAAAPRVGHDDPEVLPLHLQGRAAQALQGAARRSGATVEDQRGRLPASGSAGPTTRRPSRTCSRRARPSTRRGTPSRPTTSGSATSRSPRSSAPRWRTSA